VFAEELAKIFLMKVSVVIPCYNQGQYIDEAVDSVLSQTCRDFEIIIVNDGSTDENTLQLLKNYNKPKTRVIHTSNQGLASARNNGIKEAKGEYILPLDADDKIEKTYLEKGVALLDENHACGIVYSGAEYFGEVTGIWDLPDYSFERILLENMIFCSALFRREDWERVGGYRASMKYGWEDWDFWLSLIEAGREVRRIPEVLFYYRYKENSMINSLTKDKMVDMYVQLFENHKSLYSDNIRYVFKDYVKMKTILENHKASGTFHKIINFFLPLYSKRRYFVKKIFRWLDKYV